MTTQTRAYMDGILNTATRAVDNSDHGHAPAEVRATLIAALIQAVAMNDLGAAIEYAAGSTIPLNERTRRRLEPF